MKNLDDIMKAAQSVQEEMQKAQENLENVEVEGMSGGGLVKIRASAKGTIKGVAIDDSLMTADEKSVLEDLIAAALNDARTKADAASQEAMSEMTSGLPLPPGFKMPF